MYDNIEIALKSVDGGLQNVVKTTTDLTDLAHIGALHEVRLERNRDLKVPPANTLLMVSRFAEPEFFGGNRCCGGDSPSMIINQWHLGLSRFQRKIEGETQ